MAGSRPSLHSAQMSALWTKQTFATIGSRAASGDSGHGFDKTQHGRYAAGASFAPVINATASDIV